MFFKPRKPDTEEIIFDCPSCQEQLIVVFASKRNVIIECVECGERCSPQQARDLKKTPDQIRTFEQQYEVHQRAADVASNKGADIVRAASLTPGGKAALRRARQAKEAKAQEQALNGIEDLPCQTASQQRDSQLAGESSNNSAAPIRRSSSKSASRSNAAPYSRDCSRDGLQQQHENYSFSLQT